MLKVDSPLSPELEELVKRVVDVGFTVHKTLGPGFKEAIYERAFCLELDLRNLKFECEKKIEVKYKEWRIPGQKVDLIVEGLVLVELKSVPRIRPVHRQQVMSYLKTLDLEVGLLMNFNNALFKNGIRRVIHTIAT